MKYLAKIQNNIVRKKKEGMTLLLGRYSTHWVSGHHDSLKDQWCTDFKMLKPVIDVLIGV